MRGPIPEANAPGLLASLALLLGGCVEVQHVVPGAETLLAVADSSGAGLGAEGPLPFVGLEVEEALAGSLEEMTFLRGLRVVRVTAGSPAEAAGIRSGDLLLRAGGVDLQSADQWAALVAATAPGDRLDLAVERSQGLAEVEVEVATRTGALLAPTRFLERRKARLVVETAVAGKGGTVARVVELLSGSPLAETGLAAGDEITALDGAAINGAADLVARLGDCEYGAEVDLEVLRGGSGSEVLRAELWAPPRRITRLCVPILFDYEADPQADQKSFALIDLWLLALFDYRREGQTRRYRFLRFFQFETGTGELTEVEGPAAAATPGKGQP